MSQVKFTLYPVRDEFIEIIKTNGHEDGLKTRSNKQLCEMFDSEAWYYLYIQRVSEPSIGKKRNKRTAKWERGYSFFLSREDVVKRWPEAELGKIQEIVEDFDGFVQIFSREELGLR